MTGLTPMLALLGAAIIIAVCVIATVAIGSRRP